jgi:hypothetical protein
MDVLVSDYCTVADAAKAKGVNFYSLRNWMQYHRIPTRKVGNVTVVRLSDLEGYSPRRAREKVTA